MIFELSNKIKGILAKYYSYFLGRLYFTSNDGSQMMFVYQTTFTTINTIIVELNTLLAGDQKDYILLNLHL